MTCQVEQQKTHILNRQRKNPILAKLKPTKLRHVHMCTGEQVRTLARLHVRGHTRRAQTAQGQRMKRLIVAMLTLLLALPVQAADVIGTPLPPAPMRGPRSAPVLIVAVGEYECPFCKRAETTLNALRMEYGDRLRILWRHDPLPFHLRGRPAARASLAAERQGKFWAMHDAIFANADLSDAGLRAAAVAAGLDLARFQIDVTDPTLDERLDRETAQMTAAGVAGTPTFFINGKRLVGAQPQPSFRREIDASLAAAATLTTDAPDVDLERWQARGGAEGADLYRWLVLGKPAPAPRPPVPESAQIVWNLPLDPRDAAMGDAEAAEVTLVEFTDFQCPYCARAASTVRQLQTQYGKSLRVVVKHNPLPFHPMARPAALAAIAANRQGKFWALHDKMFEHPQDLDEGHFLRWARQAGMDLARFRRDRNDAAANRQLSEDIAIAEAVEARGTPTFFVNGRKIVGAQSADVLAVVIDEELAAARTARRKGTAWYEARVANGQTFENLEDVSVPFDLSGLPAIGAENPQATIVVVTDHQCPFCARLAPALYKMAEKYPQQVRVVFAPWMAADHPEFLHAAQTAVAAWLDGGATKFAKVDQELYAHAHELDTQLIDRIALSAGLKPQRVMELVQAGLVAAVLDRAIQVAVRGEAEGTPTVYINGRLVKHATATGIERALRSELHLAK